jgi:tetratricopeptide (TPR) repeat protein
MRDPGQEMAFLAALNQIINPFEVIVTFNGKAFDIPLLNTRHILNGFSSPFKELDHIDILPLARRIWRNRLSNRALSNLEIEILGVERTQAEVPGWMIPELYFEYLRSGDARPLTGIFYHNANDILSLAGLFYYLARMLGDPSGDPAISGLDIAALARLYEELGDLITAIQLYERSLDQGLPRDFYLQTLSRFASLYRRQGNWDGAIYLWQKAAEQQQIEACIELAKYYEHNRRDYIEAISWTQNALDLALNTKLHLFERKIFMGELNKRLERLVNKQKKASLS